MYSHRSSAANLELPAGPSRQQVAAWLRALGRRLTAPIVRDWQGQRLLAGGVSVAMLACLLALVFHINRPAPFVPYHDTLEYVRSANRIVAGGWWVDPDRLPGYPLLLAAIFLFTGKSNLVAADAAQQVLFVLSAVVVYALAYDVWRNTRYATIVGVLFATNFYFLSYVKPILSDGLALLLTVALALAIVAYIRRPSMSHVWFAACLLLALIMTRAEWYLLPVPLFAYLLLVTHQRGQLRALLPHALLAVLLIYAVIGLYIRLNAAVYGVNGLTEIEGLNLYGKVIQYQMQDEAPPQYADITRITDGYVQSKEYDPWFIYRHEPALGADHFGRLDAYARAIILHHPAQFLDYSGRVLLRSLYIHWPFADLIPETPGSGLLYATEQFSALVFPLFVLFPLCAAAWLVALWRQRHEPARRIQAEIMCALTMLTCYDLVMTTIGSYGEYPRLHLSFDPLMLIVVVGTLLMAARAVGKPGPDTVRDMDTATECAASQKA